MGRQLLKQFLQYALSLAVALVVLWYVVRDVPLSDLLDSLDKINYFWVGLSIFFALIGYFLRSWRWNILLAPLGYKPGFFRTFLALMVGYLANLALPRLGEVVRCGVLKQTDEVPVSSSLGTVVAERVVDFIFLLLTIFVALVLEFDRLQGFLTEIFAQGTRMPSATFWVYLLVAFVFLFALSWWILKTYKKSLQQNGLYRKIIAFGRDLLTGVLSIRKIQQPVGFWCSTILIWVMYYLMTYVILYSLPEASDIDLMAGLSILAMGGIGMAAPVQGGLGAYHLLVTGVLMVYGLSKSEAVLLALLLHTSQTIFVIIIGLLALLGVFLIKRKQGQNHSQDEVPGK